MLFEFMAASLVLIAIPGPDQALITRNALLRGRAAGLRTMLGGVTGLSVHAPPPRSGSPAARQLGHRLHDPQARRDRVSALPRHPHAAQHRPAGRRALHRVPGAAVCPRPALERAQPEGRALSSSPSSPSSSPTTAPPFPPPSCCRRCSPRSTSPGSAGSSASSASSATPSASLASRPAWTASPPAR